MIKEMKCNNCGAVFETAEPMEICKCPYCGSRDTIRVYSTFSFRMDNED